jgi:hypothetical protein
MVGKRREGMPALAPFGADSRMNARFDQLSIRLQAMGAAAECRDGPSEPRHQPAEIQLLPKP